MKYKKFISSLFAFGLFFTITTDLIFAQEVDNNEIMVEVAQPSLTIGRLTSSQFDTEENIAKKYLKKEVLDAKFQNDQVTSEKHVDFQVESQHKKENYTEIRLIQTYKNYKIYGQDLIVNIDKDGVVRTVSGKVAKNLNKQSELSDSNLLLENEVKLLLQESLGISNNFIEKEFKSEKYIYLKEDNNYTLAEVIAFTYEDKQDVISGNVIIDLISGEIIFKEKFIKVKENNGNVQTSINTSLFPFEDSGTGVNVLNENVNFNISKGIDGNFYLVDLTRGNGIYIYNANYADAKGGSNQIGYPGTIISSISSNFTDKYAVGIMQNLSIIYDYFKTKHNLKSYDDKDAKIIASVHGFDSEKVVKNGTKESYANAFWHSNWNQMVFGDGLNGKLTTALDLISHEYGHAIFSGITKNNIVNYPNNETKSLNEGLADFWGAQVELYNKKDKGNWVIGDNLDGLLMRDIPNEISDGGRNLITNLQDFHKSQNNQEPHVSSGIISHVLYQLAEGEEYNNIRVAKLGNEKVSKIVMHALQKYVTSSEDFKALQSHIVQAAKDLYGVKIAKKVEKVFEIHGYPSLEEYSKSIDIQTVK